MRFHEEQRFEGGWRWFWAGVILGPLVIAAALLVAIAAGSGTNLRTTFLILAVVGSVAVAGLVLLLRTPVVVSVTDEGVRVRVPPFLQEFVPAAEIAAVEEVPARLTARFGAGVGKRYAERLARYTVGNNAGIVIARTNRWRIVIGSKRSAELAAAIHTLTQSKVVD